MRLDSNDQNPRIKCRINKIKEYWWKLKNGTKILISAIVLCEEWKKRWSVILYIYWIYSKDFSGPDFPTGL
jgi:hypothetical protein